LGRVVLRVVDEDGGPLEDAPDGGVLGLVAGVPYVREWADANRAAQRLRAELAGWGIGDRVVVRAHVSAGGEGVVELGWVHPELAELLAAVLAQARHHSAGGGPAAGRGPRVA